MNKNQDQSRQPGSQTKQPGQQHQQGGSPGQQGGSPDKGRQQQGAPKKSDQDRRDR